MSKLDEMKKNYENIEIPEELKERVEKFINGVQLVQTNSTVQEEAMPIIRELGVSYTEAGNGTYIMDSVHTTAALIYQATKAGATIFNCYSVEDVVFHNDAVAGVVVNWAPVLREGLDIRFLFPFTRFREWRATLRRWFLS